MWELRSDKLRSIAYHLQRLRSQETGNIHAQQHVAADHCRRPGDFLSDRDGYNVFTAGKRPDGTNAVANGVRGDSWIDRLDWIYRINRLDRAYGINRLDWTYGINRLDWDFSTNKWFN